MKVFAIIAAAVFAAGPAFATSIVAKIPGWTIVKMTDSMTDKTSCTAVYDKDKNVWLKLDQLIIHMKDRGSVQAYRYRYDTEPATLFADRMASDSTSYWWTGDIERIVGAKRLQVQIQPIIGNVASFDIDLQRAREVHDVLKGAKCE